MLYEFYSKFHTLSNNCKIFENRLRFDKVTDSLKVGIFFETQCILQLRVMRRNVYSSAIFTGVDLFALKFYLDRVVPINHFWHHKTRDTELPEVKTASLCVPSFWYNTGVWRTDGQTDRQTDMP